MLHMYVQVDENIFYFFETYGGFDVCLTLQGVYKHSLYYTWQLFVLLNS